MSRNIVCYKTGFQRLLVSLSVCCSPNCLGRLRGAGVCPHTSMAVRVWGGERGGAGTLTGAELGLCWGQLYVLKVGHDSCRPKIVKP